VDDRGVGDEPESEELLSLDPKEWKRQDHYAVLGLSHLRYKATPEQIKIAHRKKVLKHHPDKKVSSVHNSGTSTPATSIYATLNATNTNDDAFFKCISKAHDVLTNPSRRAQFDSVDPHFDPDTTAPSAFACAAAVEFNMLPVPMDLPPALPKSITGADAKKGIDFKTFQKHLAPIFEREARFCKTPDVPMLGEENATKQEVERFYDFWYNFDSWRSFEWLDKEVNEGSDNRDDKRFTEKKNKTDRARRKKEDIARLRSLVDFTLSLDPRIKRIKQEEKEARELKKKSKSGSATNVVSAADKAAEEAKKAEAAKQKELDEAAARAEAKKAKAAAANAAKKARRAARAADGDEAA
jgi:DnaJ family protein C protein 2